MEKIVDARGLSCPEPVFLTKQMMSEVGTGTFKVLVDNQTACLNVTRICKSSGWEAQVEVAGEDFSITVSK